MKKEDVSERQKRIYHQQKGGKTTGTLFKIHSTKVSRINKIGGL